MVRVKICGITNLADALAAVEAGADALGFVFHRPSPRCISWAAAREVARAMPPFVARVGVFVDQPLHYVAATLSYCGLDYAQLHGTEDELFCAALYPRAIKALRVGRDDVLALVERYGTLFVLDTYRPDAAGGTGETFDWGIAREAVLRGKRVILSGGLTAENVGRAIAAVRPYGVDTSSGVEQSPGKKDHAKLRAFVSAARRAAG